MGLFGKLKTAFAGRTDNAGSSDSLTLAVAQRLINEYGSVIERSGGAIASEHLLPAPKETMKAALVMMVRAEKTEGQLTQQTLALLRTGYASLAYFVAPADAAIAGRFSDVAKKGAALGPNPTKEQIVQLAQELTKADGATAIQQRSVDEMARLIKEFDEIVGR